MRDHRPAHQMNKFMSEFLKYATTNESNVRPLWMSTGWTGTRLGAAKGRTYALHAPRFQDKKNGITWLLVTFFTVRMWKGTMRP